MAEARAAVEAGKGIIWLASFPKSGNTWTRILLSNLINPERVDDDDFASLNGSISSNRSAFDHYSGLPSSDLTDDEIDLLRPGLYRSQNARSPERLFIKVHDGYHDCGSGEPLFPSDASAGVIYIVRHPFDVAVSYASHQGTTDFDKIIKQLNNPDHVMAGGRKSQLRQRTMGWSGHFCSWHEQGDIPILTIRYEDMLADALACLRKMARFVGIEAGTDERALSRAVEESRFEKLRDKENRSGFREKAQRAGLFFRSGQAGDGWTMLDSEQRARIYEANRDVMERLGYSADVGNPQQR